MAQKIIDILKEKIEDKLDEINKLEIIIKDYNNLAQRMSTYVLVFFCEEDDYVQKDNDLKELNNIINEIKKLTKTKNFDNIDNMQQYLKSNVAEKYWIKFSSLYTSATNMLKSHEINKKYDAHTQLIGQIEEDEKLSLRCTKQLSFLLELRNKKIDEYNNLKKEYIRQEAIEKSLKEKNNRK